MRRRPFPDSPTIDYPFALCYNPPVDERAFIQLKQESWTQLSESLDQTSKRGPRALDNSRLKTLGPLYRAVVSDLAYARSQGASDNLIGYLNELAGRAHGVLYAGEGAKASGMVAFLLREFPHTFRATFKFTLIAAIMFFISWGLATYAVITDPSVGNRLMPERIQKHNADTPTDVPDPASMSSYIMTNNIKVGILSFAGGITAGALTSFEMAQNGAVLGAVATIAAPVMGHAKFWSLILPHGIIELVAIFICGGAGLMIGSAMIAPGNIRRADAIKLASGKALRLFAGAVAFFVVAAIIEGFITPSVIPVWFKLTFAGLTAIALVIYLGFAGSKASGVILDE